VLVTINKGPLTVTEQQNSNDRTADGQRLRHAHWGQNTTGSPAASAGLGAGRDMPMSGRELSLGAHAETIETVSSATITGC